MFRTVLFVQKSTKKVKKNPKNTGCQLFESLRFLSPNSYRLIPENGSCKNTEDQGEDAIECQVFDLC